MKSSLLWVLCCRIILSCSTLTCQLAKEQVEHSRTGLGLGYAESDDFATSVANTPDCGIMVVILHRATPEALRIQAQGEGLALCTFLDLHDVAVSAMEQIGLDFPQVWENAVLESAVGEGSVWRDQPNVELLRYEDFFQDLPSTVHTIARAAGIEVPKEAVRQIAAQHAIDAQKHRSDRVSLSKHPTSIDPDALLHPGHIQSGHPGRWRRTLEPEQVRKIEHQFRD